MNILLFLIILTIINFLIGIYLIFKLSKTNKDTSEKNIKDEFQRSREELNTIAKMLREEIMNSFKILGDNVTEQFKNFSNFQNTNFNNFNALLKELIKSNEEKLEFIRKTLEDKLTQIQNDNNKQLEKMREIVDEKLQTTLQKRLGESFKLVSERLEAVQRGLGEMQTLASDVGDLKRVLTNVKTRGTWGEVQLESLLNQLLTPEQYEKNVIVKEHSEERVEFAIKLPGKNDDNIVYLPIDSKFPQENYQRLIEASEKGNAEIVKNFKNLFIKDIEKFAEMISKKYINPPKTTDFAIMFLPTEGLYAEILRTPGELEKIQTKYRVVVSGPMSFAALLTSLRMGFRTLAIEKRTTEVWKILAAVKTEFKKFGDMIDKVKKHIENASKTLDATDTRKRAMERKLRDVEELSEKEAKKLLELE